MFEPGDPSEADFVSKCIELGLESKISKNGHFAVSESELPGLQSSFFYLETDTIKYSGPAFFDPGSGCPACKFGLTQIRNFAINPRLAGRQDIGFFTVPPVQIWVVSRRAKEIFESAGLTGCTYYPTLREDRKYAAEEMTFGADVPAIAAEAEHFQMIWNAETAVKVGAVNITKVCPTCGVVTRGPRMFGSVPPRILDGSPTDSDFLYYNQYQDVDGNMLRMRGSVRVASGRALSVMLSKKLKGIDWPYSKNPEIDFRMLPLEFDPLLA